MNLYKIAPVLHDLGKVLHLPVILSVPTFIVIAVVGEWFALLPFLAMALLCLILGQLLIRIFRSTETSKGTLAILFVAMAWLVLPVTGIIPFTGIAWLQPMPSVDVFANPASALFESMSGYTGTGLTMVSDPSQLPYVLQWWRSLLEWTGGMGVILLGMLVLDINQEEEVIYEMEAMTWIKEADEPRKKIYQVWLVYLLLTVASVLAFLVAGMPMWEALNHGITGISTGGFSVTSNSFTDYSIAIKLVAIVIMLLGALSFKMHVMLIFNRQPLRAFRLSQAVWFFGLFGFASVISYWLASDLPWVDHLFQVSSALGTCGFNSAPLQSWSVSVAFLLVVAMVLGGNSSSTAGGIKTNRFIHLTNGLWKQLKQHGTVKRPEDENGAEKGEAEDQRQELEKKFVMAASLLLVWLFTLAIGVLVLQKFEGHRLSFYQVAFDATSALSNVGLSVGASGKELGTPAKLVFAFLMWIGRLEITAVLVLFFVPLFGHSNKGRK